MIPAAAQRKTHFRACHLCEAQGAYRGPAGTALVYMTFGEVTLSQPKGKRR